MGWGWNYTILVVKENSGISQSHTVVFQLYITTGRTLQEVTIPPAYSTPGSMAGWTATTVRWRQSLSATCWNTSRPVCHIYCTIADWTVTERRRCPWCFLLLEWTTDALKLVSMLHLSSDSCTVTGCNFIVCDKVCQQMLNFVFDELYCVPIVDKMFAYIYGSFCANWCSFIEYREYSVRKGEYSVAF